MSTVRAEKSAIKNIEAKLIANIILKPEILFEVSESLHLNHFSTKICKLIYRAMLDLQDQYMDINIDSIAVKIEDYSEEYVGYRDKINEYIMTCLENLPENKERVQDYISMIRNHATKNTIKKSVEEVLTSLKGEEGSNTEVVAALMKIQEDLDDDTPATSGFLYDTLLTEMDRLEKIQNGEIEDPRIPTGLPSLDEILGGGLYKGTVTVVAGRPSHGKTSLGSQMMEHFISKLKKTGLIFSLEMPKEQMATRILYSKAKVSEAMLHSKKATAEDYDRLNETMTLMSEYRERLIIDDQSTTPERIMNSMMRNHRKHHLDVVMLDYVQDVTFPDSYSHNDLANFVKRMTKYCKENMITLILISQLRRDVDNRGDKRPNMGDLSESKKLEEVASHAISVYRDDVYTMDDSEKPGITEIRVMKNRYGKQGWADFIWEGDFCFFKDVKA